MMEPIILPRISNQKPLVSVISVTYNHEPYIRACLEGFVMQKTNFPVEFIIHDDASTDHTADIIREYYEKRPDLFHVIIERENCYSVHKPIMAPLFKMAKGKYIALCEGDDYWTAANKLQIQFDFMESNPECMLCFHNAIKLFQETAKQQVFAPDLEERFYSKEELASEWIVPTASMFFLPIVAKEMLLLKQKNKGCFLAGDILIYLSAAQKGKVFAKNSIMSVYRINATGIHNCYIKPKQYYHYKLIQKVFDIQAPRFNKVLSDAAYAIAKTQIKQHHFLSFVKFSFLCLYYDKNKVFKVLRIFKRNPGNNERTFE